MNKSSSKGLIYMLVGMFCFVSANALFKMIEHPYPITQIVFFRYFFAIFPSLIYLIILKRLKNLKTDSLKIHFFRGFVGFISLIFLFQSIRLLPLSDAVTISFTTSIFVVIFSIVILKEQASLLTWLAIIIGFTGVIIISKPEANLVKFGAVYGIFSAVAEGFILVHTRLISAKTLPAVTTFYYSLFAAIFGFICLAFSWIPPSQIDLILLICVGLLGGTGQLLTMQAISLTSGQVLAPLIYTQIIWSILYDLILFDEIPSNSLYSGGGLIIAAGLVMIFKDKIIQIKQTN